MSNVCTFRRSLIRGYLPNPTLLAPLFHPLWTWQPPSPPPPPPRGYPGNPSTTLAVLICQCGTWGISRSVSLSSFLTLCPVVSRTPSRITKTNSSLVVSCNLRKTRATISEHGPTSLKFLMRAARVEDEYLILHYYDCEYTRRGSSSWFVPWKRNLFTLQYM